MIDKILDVQPRASLKAGGQGLRYRCLIDGKKNKWYAEITLRGKHYHLGKFNEKEDAIRARKDAEEKLFAPIIEIYEK